MMVCMMVFDFGFVIGVWCGGDEDCVMLFGYEMEDL